MTAPRNAGPRVHRVVVDECADIQSADVLRLLREKYPKMDGGVFTVRIRYPWWRRLLWALRIGRKPRWFVGVDMASGPDRTVVWPGETP